MEKEDRSKYYKEPLKYGAQTLYESRTLEKISLEHWNNFDAAVASGKGFKVGDFIDLAVNTTAIQLVRFLDELVACESVDEMRNKAKCYINEIQKEVKLPHNEEGNAG